MSETFTCQTCGKDFTVPKATLAKFPGWKPKQCMSCKTGGTARKGPMHSREENLTTAQVLEKYSGGPSSGVFTDGAAEPNPGPGGWGAVYVIDGKVVAEKNGHKPHTTNNEMELIAMHEAIGLIPDGVRTALYTDSKLCKDTFNTWAKGWEAKGWKKKGGPIKNLELIQRIYGVLQRRPEIQVEWIQAHAGNLWNEYADALATKYRRD